MPKITFYNLPDNKKKMLIHAAKKEFSRVPLNDASISNIIKTARIPRGSFYQYFEDKEDAYFFLLNEFVININDNFVLLLKKYDGDLFETMIDFFQLIIEEEENVTFLENAFLNMTYKIEYTFSKIFRDCESNENIKEITDLINTSGLNISNDRDLRHIMQIISTITFRNVVEKFGKELSQQEALSNYIIEINLLKNGLARK
ncbi:hypothetical protein BACCIP111895_00939 [Neobacillus rhizosphaerae]|uniref:HTH tetR-type domain-containing protein n=1 Tax=Neobacillus rhizosphaerae TaxID=2880965 RepID=A0ABM9EMG9_9BACI|nr:TetR/AcrR family transcriptional regulator [Neobacillus rhizosphaerae]CAH2713785.1 hypothetical protein BACCIP111895_00939 [Neobacillus rhizosphaerae]